MPLLKIISTAISPGLQSPATFLFNRLVGQLLQRFGRLPIMCDNDKSNNAVLKSRQPCPTVKQILT